MLQAYNNNIQHAQKYALTGEIWWWFQKFGVDWTMSVIPVFIKNYQKSRNTQRRPTLALN